jgi:hypothetical protein
MPFFEDLFSRSARRLRGVVRSVIKIKRLQSLDLSRFQRISVDRYKKVRLVGISNRVPRHRAIYFIGRTRVSNIIAPFFKFAAQSFCYVQDDVLFLGLF